MKENYTYDAFISYRHTELDKFVVEQLHKALEAYKPPKSIRRQAKASRSRIERVFRDKDELPITSNLEDPIVQALIHSEFLIVICSPRLKESIWCKKEIETFIQYHGKGNVLTVLIEGEPEESFPEELLYVEETVTGADGTQETVRRAVEPLAADVRGKSRREIRKKIRSEMLRLLAPMFGVGYDDLRQRHRERKLKKVITASLSAAVFCLLIGVAGTLAALLIHQQNVQIEAQSQEILAQSEKIVNQSREIQKQNEVLAANQAESLAEKALSSLEEGDREGAVSLAVQALTEYEGIEMPYTAEAKYALTESLHIYDSSNTVYAEYQIAAPGEIEEVIVSPDRNTVLTLDATGSLCVWDILSGELKDTLAWNGKSAGSGQTAAFADNGRILYRDEEDRVCVYDIDRGCVTAEVAIEDVYSFSSDPYERYVAVKTWSGLIICDTADFQTIYQAAETKETDIEENCYFSESGILVYLESFTSDTVPDTAQGGILHFVDLVSGAAEVTVPIAYNGLKHVQFKNDCVYILANALAGDGSDYSTGLIVFDLSSNTVKWERSFDRRFGSELCLPYAQDAHRLMVCSAMEAFLLDVETGEETGNFSTESSILEAAAYLNKDYFMLFTRSGRYYMYAVEYDELFIMDYAFQCKSDNVKYFYVTEGGSLVLPYNDNRITVYNVIRNPDIQPYEGEAEPVLYDDDGTYRDYTEEAKELGLARANLVSHILTVPDGGFTVVSYVDYSIEVYRTEDMALLDTFVGRIGGANRYFGEDAEGNLYIGGEFRGYCLDSSGKLIARIEDMAGLDREQNMLIVGESEELQSIPIYTTQELVERGRSLLTK